jgi:hypothetical protein
MRADCHLTCSPDFNGRTDLDYEVSKFFIRPGLSVMVACIKGWFDDSRRGPIWAVAGYIGGLHRWEHFDTHWPMALANHDLPYFHMREMADPKGVFGKWHPPQDHRAELADFFSGLAKVIGQSRLVGICSLVRVADLDRFNADHGLTLEPYSLAAYGCMLLTVRENLPGMPIELVFDHVEQVESKLAKARAYADSDKTYEPGICDATAITGLPKACTWREIPALQAADFFAWEFRKNHENVSEWFDFMDKPDDWDARWDHFEQWSLDKFGSKIPTTRKSAVALLDGNEFYAMIWDYKNLCDAHTARGGVWA